MKLPHALMFRIFSKSFPKINIKRSFSTATQRTLPERVVEKEREEDPLSVNAISTSKHDFSELLSNYSTIDDKLNKLMKLITANFNVSFERPAAVWLSRKLKIRTFDRNPEVRIQQKIRDDADVVHEIDVISYKHSVVMECKLMMKEEDFSDLENFQRKRLLIEQQQGKTVKAYFTTYEIDDSINAKVHQFLNENNIEFFHGDTIIEDEKFY